MMYRSVPTQVDLAALDHEAPQSKARIINGNLEVGATDTASGVAQINVIVEGRQMMAYDKPYPVPVGSAILVYAVDKNGNYEEPHPPEGAIQLNEHFVQLRPGPDSSANGSVGFDWPRGIPVARLETKVNAKWLSSKVSYEGGKARLILFTDARKTSCQPPASYRLSVGSEVASKN